MKDHCGVQVIIAHIESQFPETEKDILISIMIIIVAHQMNMMFCRVWKNTMLEVIKTSVITLDTITNSIKIQ